MKKIIVASVLVCVACIGHAQNFKDAVVKAQRIYNQLERLHAVMQIDIYETPSSPRAYISELAEVRRDGDNYRTHYGDVDFLLNKRYMVGVNRATRQIQVNGQQNDSGNGFVDPIKMNLDSLLDTYHETQYLGTKDKLERYKMTMNDGPVESIIVSFNTTTSLVQKISYVYRGGLLVSIAFTTFDQQPVFDEKVFDEHNFIVMQSKKIIPASAYRDYNIVYQPSIKRQVR